MSGTAIVVGGGFYGANIAHYLKTVRKFTRVVLIEREEHLLARSSFSNQARVHRGCHYPRSFTTAHSSIVNAPRFEADFGGSIFSDFTALYALARRGSKVTALQMERFCREAGIWLAPAPKDLLTLFNPVLVEKVYLTTEHAFNADALRAIMTARLRDAGVEVRLKHEVRAIVQSDRGVIAAVEGERGPIDLTADYAFSCTYSRLQTLAGTVVDEPLGLKHEISEMVLVEPPAKLAQIGVTLMDGPFFSMMPFPARGLHSLSHVRYTPHAFWKEDGTTDPYARLASYHRESRADWMIRDAARYIPAIAEAKPRSSLFEVKTVLTRNEGDDGRPILLRRHGPHGRMLSVLGGKIDNIYDIYAWLDTEDLGQTGRMFEWTH